MGHWVRSFEPGKVVGGVNPRARKPCCRSWSWTDAGAGCSKTLQSRSRSAAFGANGCRSRRMCVTAFCFARGHHRFHFKRSSRAGASFGVNFNPAQTALAVRVSIDARNRAGLDRRSGIGVRTASATAQSVIVSSANPWGNTVTAAAAAARARTPLVRGRDPGARPADPA